MDRTLIAAAIAAAVSLSSLAAAGAFGLPPLEGSSDVSDVSDASAAMDKFWPGMWLWNSDNKLAVHLGPSTISEAWTGPAAYLRYRDAGVRESAAKWLKALAEHARPALPDLLAVLDDDSEEVRRAAEEALEAIDPGWRSRPLEELEALAAKAPSHVKIEASIVSYGFPLRGRQATFPLESDAEFGIEVTLDNWWGRPRSTAVDLDVGDLVVFAIGDPERFAATHFRGSGVEELEGSALELTLEPEMRPDGLWSFTLEKAAVHSVLRF